MRPPIKKQMHCVSVIEACTMFALIVGVPGFVHASDGTTVGGGGTQNITGPDGVCRQVINYNGASLYVPTTSVGEWQSFYNLPPSGVSANGACPCVPNGTETALGSTCPGYDIYDSCGNWIRFDAGSPCT